MQDAYICDAVRTPIGRYGGSLSSIRCDDLAALPLRALRARHPELDWGVLDDIWLGCANQAGEDNRNVARMAGLLAGLPMTVAGVTLNRLCGSGMDAVGSAARCIALGEADLLLAGGVESMSRAPMVLGKAAQAFERTQALFDTTIGWRFINPLMAKQFGTDSMPQTADNVAAAFGISRADQDRFALQSQQRWQAAQQQGRFAAEIIPVTLSRPRQPERVFDCDEHPRPEVTLEGLAKLSGINGKELSVTAGNASGVNDGACALLLASARAVQQHGLRPLTRVLGMACAGVEPRLMGIGPVPASRKLLQRLGLRLEQMDVIEINEAFAAQALAVLRELGLPEDADYINPNGGAIAMGHPLGMSGARLLATASYELQRRQGRYALCSMCIGVGQGIAVVLERVS
ncbi:acetyl-CoA acetyltransferase [Aquitalea magnusonii]|uniref:Acetyl-CoA acetyltransferase n=1 Tax=Aquitalea magnusonii TaxID=332411 RepID=A0A3G9GGZ6_9NEIS|nr:3-oxoadipyl-CoA thiolase [Aquitalea magnusonii]BBF87148.1 acetyl-CoA acetyltransferase [Aquitalea magnusonii]